MTKLMLRRQLAAQQNRKRGFTLIELIVVIVIIAIIAAIAVPSLTRYITSAEKRQVQAVAHNIQLVLQAERTDFYYETFANGGSGTTSFTGGKTYLEILNASGISLVAPAALTDIIWGDDPALSLTEEKYANTTLTAFTYTNGKFTIKYQIDTGFQDPY